MNKTLSKSHSTNVPRAHSIHFVLTFCVASCILLLSQRWSFVAAYRTLLSHAPLFMIPCASLQPSYSQPFWMVWIVVRDCCTTIFRPERLIKAIFSLMSCGMVSASTFLRVKPGRVAMEYINKSSECVEHSHSDCPTETTASECFYSSNWSLQEFTV